MDTRINYCGASHCSDHNDPSKVIRLWVTVTCPLQATATLMWGNNPSKKGFLTQDLAFIWVQRLNSQPIRWCAPLTTDVLLTRKDRHPPLNSWFYYPVSDVPAPTYITDILSCELSITAKCVAATNAFYHTSSYPGLSVLKFQALACCYYAHAYNNSRCWEKNKSKLWNDFVHRMNEIWYHF